jgi:putative glutamine amidotransferase
MTRRPTIGIVPSFDMGEGAVYFPGPKTERLYIRTEYTHVLVSVGAMPIILSPDMPLHMIADLCDGVVISGGFDIDAALYGQTKLTEEPVEPIKRFMWEERLIAACDESNIPILGICYGMQRLNIYYGGTLLQDIPTLLADSIEHNNAEHAIEFYENFLGIVKQEVRSVASRHHQAINMLADGFNVAAAAPDGIIEAIEGRGHFGMQWHPESDSTGIHMYRAFVEHCMRV